VNEDILEMFREILDEMKEYSNNGVPLIVEGKRDEASLRRIGFSGPIVTVSGARLHEIAEKSRGREVIVLTDFDEEGERLAETILSYRVENDKLTVYFRGKIRKLKAHVTPCVEGFAKLYFKAENTRRENVNLFEKANLELVT